VDETEGEPAVTEGTHLTEAPTRRDAGRHMASRIVDLVELGPEPDRHLDRSLYAHGNATSSSRATPRETSSPASTQTANADSRHPLAGEPRRTMSPTR
jgi:hypothetical protein